MSAKMYRLRETVATTDQQEHLATNHLGPHYFWFNARKHRTMKPSMTAADLKRLAHADQTYPVFEEREGGDIAYGDSIAIDLTREPHFYAVPYATTIGG